MIDPGAEKTQVIMACATIQGRRYMTIGFSGADGIVVAVATSILRQISCAVIEKARGETARAMAADTIVRRSSPDPTSGEAPRRDRNFRHTRASARRRLRSNC